MEMLNASGNHGSFCVSLPREEQHPISSCFAWTPLRFHYSEAQG